MHIWKFDPERQEFDRVMPATMKRDPTAYYVIRDHHGDLLVRDPWDRECPAQFDSVEVLDMTFDREQFDPEQVDGLRTRTEPPTRSLLSLTPEQIEDMRAEMRRDGLWMREKLRRE